MDCYFDNFDYVWKVTGVSVCEDCTIVLNELEVV
jgi:hypothetical protein